MPYQAGGLTEISRWLTERDSAEMASPKAMARRAGYGRVPASAGGHIHNEARRATPPVFVIQENRIPKGCQMAHAFISGIPPGCCVLSMVIRWCRSFLAQPPANICHASGMKNRLVETSKTATNRASSGCTVAWLQIPKSFLERPL